MEVAQGKTLAELEAEGWKPAEAATPPPAGGAWVDGPTGKTWQPDNGAGGRNRADTNIVGIDHAKVAASIANWASTLPEKYQRPAAMLATFPADVLSSLVEMFSAPETVATAGAPVAMDVLGAVAGAPAAVGRGAMRSAAAVGDLVHPDVVGIVSPRAGQVVRVAQKLRNAAAEAPASAPASAPAASPAAPVAAPAAPVAPSPAAPPITAPAPPVVVRGGDTIALPAAQRTAGQMSEAALTNDVGIAARRLKVPLTLPEAQGLAKQVAATGQSPLDVVRGFRPAAVEKLRLTADETALALRMAKQGAKPTDIQAAITALRQSPMGRMPSTQTVQAAVAGRNATGRWK